MTAGQPDPAEIKALERELADLREARTAAQRRVAERATLTVALERVSRDRSAQSSPSIEQARDRVQGLYDELTDSWHGCDRIRVMADRLRRRAGHTGDFRGLDAAFDAENQGRQATVRRATEAGFDVQLLTAAAHPPSLEDGES